MTSFDLQIVTPDGRCFDGEAQRLTIPTIQGQVGILARHINYVTALGMGTAKVLTQNGERCAACIGGMVAVTDGSVKVVATTFEWADEIDVARAEASMARGEKMLAAPDCDEQTKQYANARIKRAKIRLNVAKKNK